MTSKSATAQNTDWESFRGHFEGTPGLIDVNVALKKKGPIAKQPFLVMTSMKIKRTTKNGLASLEEMPVLSAFSDSVESLLKRRGAYSYAGNFIHQGVCINYFYVGDSTGIWKDLTSIYAKRFPDCTLGLNVKHEKKWQTFFEFLYPGDDIIAKIRSAKNGKPERE